jgi:hypothetical protein
MRLFKGDRIQMLTTNFYTQPRFSAYAKETIERRQAAQMAEKLTQLKTLTPKDATDLVAKLVKALKENDGAPNWHYCQPKDIIASYEKQMLDIVDKSPLETVQALNRAIEAAPSFTVSDAFGQVMDTRLASGK